MATKKKTPARKTPARKPVRKRRVKPAPLEHWPCSGIPAITAYWLRVHIIAASLAPEDAILDELLIQQVIKHNPHIWPRSVENSTKPLFVTSRDLPKKAVSPGKIFAVLPYLAATLIVDGTHRLSTPAEIEDWHKEQEERTASAASPPEKQIRKLSKRKS